MEKVILTYFIVITLITFIVYGLDKWKAQNGYWRISEKMLFFLAIIGGSVGALAGMKLFRHKTQHTSFVIGIPMILVVQIIAMVVWFLK